MDPTRLADVIERAQRREPAAFEFLVEAYSRRLYGFLYRLTGNRDEAEDLLQDVYVRVVRMIGSYEHDGRFEAWLFRIALNLVRDRVRRMSTAPVARATGQGPADNGEEQVDVLKATPAGRPGPAEMAELADEVDRLQWALDRLSPAEREVIMLRHFSDMSFNEIAAVMGTPLGTALARAHRGLGHLRGMLEGPSGS